jgi:hypothetical protein
MPVLLFLVPLWLGMPVADDPPPTAIVAVPLMDLLTDAVLFVPTDALAGSGFTTFSYAEQSAFGANEQSSCPCPCQQLPNPMQNRLDTTTYLNTNTL